LLAGWANQRQQDALEYLREENRALREQLGNQRIRFTDDQRIRLAEKAKGLGGSSGAVPFERIILVILPDAVIRACQASRSA